MLDSRPCGARMTRLGLGLDFRLRGNDEVVVDSRLCGGGNDGSCGGGCFLAIGCKKGGAKNQAQEGYCRLPIADCRLPIADCRLPIADSTAAAFAVKLVWLVCVMSFPLVLCQWPLPPTKVIIPTKTRMSKLSVIPALAGMTPPLWRVIL